MRLRIASAFSVSLLLVALSGCRLATPGHIESFATAIPQATATPATLPTLPTAQTGSGVCGNAPLSPAGGLVVAQHSGMGNLAYPDAQILPSGQTGPITPPALGNDTYTDGSVLVVNPSLQEGGGGYTLLICNPSSQAHTISAVQVSIARIIPYTAKLEAWVPCTGVYRTGGYGGGCGGGDPQDGYFHAPFAADASVSTTLTATQTRAGAGESPFGPLPVALNPGQTMSIEIGVSQPSAPGYYTYGFGLTVDGAATETVAYSPTTLLAPVSVNWSGQACTSPKMQAQIAQQPTPAGLAGYICPAS